ncbi:MAG: hypothetical protein HY394_00145 [Candidatus Diapherotrites archaeon]|nr:hypothetical protein [Candidatus Diapherotrites archaeon]
MSTKELALRQTRLRLRRAREVRHSTERGAFVKKFKNFVGRAEHRIAGGRIALLGFGSDNDLAQKGAVAISFGRDILGVARIRFSEPDRLGRVAVLIDEFQGEGGSREAQRQNFRQKNGAPWNVVLVRSIIDAAYNAGFNRVLLQDPKTIEGYEFPVPAQGVDLFEDAPALFLPQAQAEVRTRMEKLYNWTKRDCDFSGEDWLEVGGKKRHYWVREFP